MPPKKPIPPSQKTLELLKNPPKKPSKKVRELLQCSPDEIEKRLNALSQEKRKKLAEDIYQATRYALIELTDQTVPLREEIRTLPGKIFNEEELNKLNYSITQNILSKDERLKKFSSHYIGEFREINSKEIKYISSEIKYLQEKKESLLNPKVSDWDETTQPTGPDLGSAQGTKPESTQPEVSNDQLLGKKKPVITTESRIASLDAEIEKLKQSKQKLTEYNDHLTGLETQINDQKQELEKVYTRAEELQKLQKTADQHRRETPPSGGGSSPPTGKPDADSGGKTKAPRRTGGLSGLLDKITKKRQQLLEWAKPQVGSLIEKARALPGKAIESVHSFAQQAPEMMNKAGPFLGMVAVGAGMAIIADRALQAFDGFSHMMDGIGRKARLSTEQTEQLSNRLQELATQFGPPAAVLAQAWQAMEKLNLPAEQATAMLEHLAKMSAAEPGGQNETMALAPQVAQLVQGFGLDAKTDGAGLLGAVWKVAKNTGIPKGTLIQALLGLLQQAGKNPAAAQALRGIEGIENALQAVVQAQKNGTNPMSELSAAAAGGAGRGVAADGAAALDQAVRRRSNSLQSRSILFQRRLEELGQTMGSVLEPIIVEAYPVLHQVIGSLTWMLNNIGTVTATIGVLASCFLSWGLITTVAKDAFAEFGQMLVGIFLKHPMLWGLVALGLAVGFLIAKFDDMALALINCAESLGLSNKIPFLESFKSNALARQEARKRDAQNQMALFQDTGDELPSVPGSSPGSDTNQNGGTTPGTKSNNALGKIPGAAAGNDNPSIALPKPGPVTIRVTLTPSVPAGVRVRASAANKDANITMNGGQVGIGSAA